jgi:hypothetical protein
LFAATAFATASESERLALAKACVCAPGDREILAFRDRL